MQKLKQQQFNGLCGVYDNAKKSKNETEGNFLKIRYCTDV